MISSTLLEITPVHMIPVLVFTGWKGIWPNEVKSQLHHKSHRPHTELHFRKLNFGLHIC